MKSVLCLTKKKTNGSPKDSCSHLSQTARWHFFLSIFSMDEQRLGDNFMQTTACVSIQTYFEHSSWAKENEQLINLDWVNKLKQKHTKSQQSETTHEKKMMNWIYKHFLGTNSGLLFAHIFRMYFYECSAQFIDFQQWTKFLIYC